VGGGSAESPITSVKRESKMKVLSLEEAADYLEGGRIEITLREGRAFINVGRSATGVRFVLVADDKGEAALTEAM